MKRYLMTGMAALVFCGVFTSCSHDTDFGGNNPQLSVQETYEEAFITRFGQPVATQDWGFGDSRASTRSGNTGETYPATHKYTDANGNVIAGANMNHNEWADPNQEFGGWVVPDALTEGQKLRVKLYFQANPNLSYQDPHFRHFFVQQVYTGGTSAPTTGNQEATAGANGDTHAGMTLNQLTVGEACSHINDFNAGTCTASNVLDNGKTVNSATYHSDQITLMVNVDDTSCFGYHETSGSNTGANNNHNDKMALVSAATIDTWAAQNGNPGEAVTDKWNRSFMGFDYELLPESDIITDSYALLSAVPNLNNIPYAWDGEKIMTIGEAPESTETTKNDDFDLFPYFALHASGSNNNGQTATCTTADGKISCYFPQYTSITFGQGNQDWAPYSKLVVEFEASPINGSIMNIPFSVGDTSVEVNLNNEHWYGDDQGPTISTYDGSTGTLNITSVRLIGKTIEGVTVDPSMYYNPTYLLGDADNQKVAFYSTNTNMYGGIVRQVSEDEMKTTQDGKTCLDLTFFQGLVADGYHPITTDLKTWVKWQAACDGYYSDWIVTLTEAQRIGDDDDDDDDDDNDEYEEVRVIAEDLSIDQKTDFDFNDVVFDVRRYTSGAKSGQAEIILQAAGGTLPLYVDGHEVHAAFGLTDTKTMVNTKANFLGYNGIDNLPAVTIPITNNTSKTIRELARDIRVYVIKKVDKVETECDLTAPLGDVASKIAVGTDFDWCNERQDIDNKYSLKDGTSLFKEYVQGLRGEKWYLEFEEK